SLRAATAPRPASASGWCCAAPIRPRSISTGLGLKNTQLGARSGYSDGLDVPRLLLLDFGVTELSQATDQRRDADHQEKQAQDAGEGCQNGEKIHTAACLSLPGRDLMPQGGNFQSDHIGEREHQGGQ